MTIPLLPHWAFVVCYRLNFTFTFTSKRCCINTQWRPRRVGNITAYLTEHLLTYLLTPWYRVLLEKLTGLQLAKKFLAFHGTRMFITALTSVRHLSLSWASPIQSIYPHPTSWRSILILSNHQRLGLPSGLFPSGSPPGPYTPPPLTHTRHMPSPSPLTEPYLTLWPFFKVRNVSNLWTWRREASKNDSWPLKMEPLGYAITSAWNYHYSLRNDPEERSYN